MNRQALAQAQAWFAAGRFEAALQAAQSVLADDPQDLQALTIAANAAMQIGADAIAAACLQRLLVLRPGQELLLRNLSRMHNRLGLAAQRGGDDGAARAAFRQALALWPEHREARFNLAQLERRCRAWDAAAEHFSRLHQADPDDEEVALALAEVRIEQGLQAAAAVLCDRPWQRLDLYPRWRELALELGWVDRWRAALPSNDTGTERIAACLDAAQQLADQGGSVALPLIADGVEPLAVWLATRLSLPTVPQSLAEIAVARARFERGIDELESEVTASRLRQLPGGLTQLVWSNFLLAYQGQDDRELQSRYGEWLCRAAAVLRPDLVDPPGQRQAGRVRVGLISGNWYDCTVGHYFASWIAAFSDAGFETHVLAVGPRFDLFTDRLAGQGARLHRLDADPNLAADAIRALDLDLAVYPEIGMDARILPLAALPLARRQWMAWGHPVTSGLPSIHTYLSVAAMEPAGADQHYCERLATLPGLGTRYALPDVPLARGRAELGLPEGPLMVLPQSAFKIHPDNDAVIATVLDEVPAARLLLFAPASHRHRRLLERRLSDRLGRAFDRLCWQPMTSREHFLQLLASCDVMQDSLHWSGGNTSLDALRVGLPIVTCPGRAMRGRQSAALLKAVQASDDVVEDAASLARRLSAHLSAPRGGPSIDQEQLLAFAQSNQPLSALVQLAESELNGVV
ncbi:MAG: hypothetical protein AB7V26_01120 [Lysobacterales bacterium]